MISTRKADKSRHYITYIIQKWSLTLTRRHSRNSHKKDTFITNALGQLIEWLRFDLSYKYMLISCILCKITNIYNLRSCLVVLYFQMGWTFIHISIRVVLEFHLIFKKGHIVGYAHVVQHSYCKYNFAVSWQKLSCFPISTIVKHREFV